MNESEADFQKQVVALAEIRGWQWMHVRRARLKDSWLTSISGTIGRGWPDLFLARPKDRRLLAVELKRVGEKPTPEQFAVLAILEAAGAETAWWTPDDWHYIEKVLR